MNSTGPLNLQDALTLAVAHHNSGRWADAERIYRQILQQQPNQPDALHLLGLVAAQAGQNQEAITLITRAISLRPGDPTFFNNLGNILKDAGRLEDAVAACREAIRLKPDYPEAHNNLGITLSFLGKVDEAIDCYRQAIHLKPGYAKAYNNLANDYKSVGRIDDALAGYRQALKIQPDYSSAAGNVLYTIHFHPDYDAKKILDEHLAWRELFADPLKKLIEPHANDHDPDRPLRVGFVSPDFREHPVARFLLPLLSNFDRRAFETICYSDVKAPDVFTARLKVHTSDWHDTAHLSDRRLAAEIRRDKIDILVDLTMHMAANRMLAFAEKPAPVQVTYLAYCSTTGLDVMDYRLTDPHLDPPGDGDLAYTEKSIRLRTYWCYPGDDQLPDPGPLPALKNGFVTFGCLNSFAKLSAQTINLWINLMLATPNSRLLLSAPRGQYRLALSQIFYARGVDPSRLQFTRRVDLPEYFQLFGGIDIALDPFPCNGGTTTCDNLWMGVPVVTLRGRTAVGRGGASVLGNIGLPELIARTPDEYLQIAAHLAGDLPRLANLRQSLRARMRASPLTDAPAFARTFESALRSAWRNWCAGTVK